MKGRALPDSLSKDSKEAWLKPSKDAEHKKREALKTPDAPPKSPETPPKTPGKKSDVPISHHPRREKTPSRESSPHGRSRTPTIGGKVLPSVVQVVEGSDEDFNDDGIVVPKEVELPDSPDPKEKTRLRLSLFAQKETKHSLKLALGASMLNAIVKCRSMCAYSSRAYGGTQVAVIVDQYRQIPTKTILRLGEMCVEYHIVVVAPNESREEAEEGSFHSELRMLTPGGPTVKTMAASIVMAATQVIIDNQDNMPQFAPLLEGSSGIIMRAESPVHPTWKDDFEVRIDEDGSIWQQMPVPKLLKLVNPQQVCEALNINLLALQTDFPIQIVQSVGKHMIVAMRSRRCIETLDPLFDLISEVCRQAGCDGIHMFSMDPVAGGTLHTRNLSPLVLIEEEAASASANAALVAYLHFHRILPMESGETIVCEQGYAFGMKPRPSKLYVQMIYTPTEPAPMFDSDTGLTSQNNWIGEAVGPEVTRERLMGHGDRYTSNVTDESRFHLAEGYYEEREAEERQRKFKMERAKRQGLIYKEEVKPHVSTAVMPPVISQPAPIASCWVGGTAVPSDMKDYEIRVWRV
eukprot:CAMPEP_0169456124 /NCGR_PEP_ID=MMETSP1042-20121227/16182_1 /TAXON_ID=464988 /ORGANISM="Hemiselmis andersenii, Strain CCMP1180" /LENGTH=576 /DNA_ID=CAMNT_0009568319 /DNA_START=70 /DNA_END=1797 /DNA_ORIENTATION=-